ncbi:MAG TPA: FAD-dependent oxidoreductase [Terriglobia bacterium]|nr:FAD-dependent oxidoreductase [Terriglobia bacterium]
MKSKPSRLGRRRFVKTLAAGIALGSGLPDGARAQGGRRMSTPKTYDVAVIGAGVFGAWTAYQLNQRGQSVVLVDSYGPANSRASSGGESRIIRMGYGKDEVYTRWAMRALPMWQEFFALTLKPLFQPTGVLWLARQLEGYVHDCHTTLERLGANIQRLDRAALAARYPQINLESVAWGLLEPSSGVLMARRAVEAVVDQAVANGVDYLDAEALAPQGSGEVHAVATRAGGTIRAGAYVYACGPWLPKVFPDLLGPRIFPTRQEVFFFGVPPGDARFNSPALPTWINMEEEAYGMPNLESRGLKVAIDHHGPRFDPDSGLRTPSSEGLDAARSYVARLFPAMKDAPVVETRVCQYENTSNGDFLVDRHPALHDVWLVGGGSGHGFKHGPAMGEYVADRVLEGGEIEPRFTLSTKGTLQHRAVF